MAWIYKSHRQRLAVCGTVWLRGAGRVLAEHGRARILQITTNTAPAWWVLVRSGVVCLGLVRQGFYLTGAIMSLRTIRITGISPLLQHNPASMSKQSGDALK